MPGFATTPAAAASGSSRVISQILDSRSSGGANLGSWLLNNYDSITADIFQEPRFLELNAGELMILRAVSPRGVFTPATKQVYLQRFGAETDMLADCLFTVEDDLFLGRIPIQWSERWTRDLETICNLAYQKHIRPYNSVVEAMSRIR